MIKDRKILIVSGVDAESFLQQILTNDIRNIGEGLLYNLLLSPQGKLLHDMFILRVAENEYWLDCYQPAVEDIVEIFNKYKLGSKVEFSINDRIVVSNSSDGYRDPRHEELKFRAYSTEKSAETADDSNIYYKLCLPRLYIDFESGKYFPFDIGYDNFNSINYTKGCYVGQEVITRTHHRGVVRKKVYKILLENELLSDSEVYVREQKVGRLIGIYGNGKALAILNSELISENLTLSDGSTIKIVKILSDSEVYAGEQKINYITGNKIL